MGHISFLSVASLPSTVPGLWKALASVRWNEPTDEQQMNKAKFKIPNELGIFIPSFGGF